MKKLFIVFFCLWSVLAAAQQRTPYNQYYSQPVLINPAYTGVSGVSSIMLNHRVQWSGIRDAPVTTSAIIQVPVTERISLGGELYSDRHSSVLKTYEAKFNGAYTIYFDNAGKNFLTFGLSLGVGRNMIDFEGTDQAIMNAQDRSFYFNGRFGTAVTMGRASFGFSLPQLMDTDILNEKDFEDLGLEATKQSIVHASYKIPLSPVLQFEPMGLYRIDKYGENQAEAVGILYYKELLWGGAGYRQDYGAIAYLGLNVLNSFQVGYSYEFAPEQSTGLGNGSHEFQISYTFGKQNKRRKQRQIITSQAVAPKQTKLASEAPVEKPAEASEEKVVTSNPDGKRTVTTSAPVAVAETVSDRPAPSAPASEMARHEPDPEMEELAAADKTEVEWLEVDESREVSSLPKGCYLVVGAFVKSENAIRYQSAVSNLGYRAEVAYDNSTNFNYVYINKSVEAKYLHAQRDVIRKKDILYFPEAWILEIR